MRSKLIIVIAMAIMSLTIPAVATASTKPQQTFCVAVQECGTVQGMTPAHARARAANGLGWICTLGGGIAGGGFWITLAYYGIGGADFLAFFGGVGFAAGCQTQENYRHPWVISGLPRNGSCWKQRQHNYYGRVVTRCFA